MKTLEEISTFDDFYIIFFCLFQIKDGLGLNLNQFCFHPISWFVWSVGPLEQIYHNS